MPARKTPADMANAQGAYIDDTEADKNPGPEAARASGMDAYNYYNEKYRELFKELAKR